MHFIDIIILLVLVFVIYNKLKKALGTRPEGEKTEISEQTAAKIFDIIIKEAKISSDAVDKGEIVPLVVNDENLSDLDKTLFKIPQFNKEKFTSNAKRAFELILSAFSNGDVDTLKDLVSTTLFKKFKEVIEKRKKDGITAETEFIGFEAVEIEEAKILKSNTAKIIMKFVSEQINILKNDKDEIIEGDANFIQSITDIWTFEKDITSTSPKWLLASTKK